MQSEESWKEGNNVHVPSLELIETIQVLNCFVMPRHIKHQIRYLRGAVLTFAYSIIEVQSSYFGNRSRMSVPRLRHLFSFRHTVPRSLRFNNLPMYCLSSYRFHENHVPDFSRQHQQPALRVLHRNLLHVTMTLTLPLPLFQEDRQRP